MRMAGLTPHEFVSRWRGVMLKERSASQLHFIDLCRLLDQPTPTEANPTGEFYAFERGAEKAAGPTGSGHSWADVWKKGHFAWEYKGPKANLENAHARLDAAVFAAYGWPPDLSDEEVLQNMLTLNLQRYESH